MTERRTVTTISEIPVEDLSPPDLPVKRPFDPEMARQEMLRRQKIVEAMGAGTLAQVSVC